MQYIYSHDKEGKGGRGRGALNVTSGAWLFSVESHEGREKGKNHLPCPAGHVSFATAQDAVHFVGCKHTLPAHMELLIN